MVRIGVLQQIGRHPEKALAYGRHEGKDVLDMLIEQLRDMPSGQLRHAHILALANFRQARAVEFLMRDLPTNQDTESVRAIIVRLGEEQTEAVRCLLVEMLQRDVLSAHARTAAGVLAWWPDWEPDLPLRLRMALLSDLGRPEPPLFEDDSAELWLEQLRGPLAAHAWEYLELQGLPTFTRIGMRWDKLDDRQRLTLLEWGGRKFLPQVAGMLRQTLSSSNDSLILEALRQLARLPLEQEAHQARLRELWAHERLDLRCAVVRAGLRDLDWERLLSETSEVDLRRELLVAFARHCPSQALPCVMSCLEAPEWQIRAAATQLCIAAGEAALEGARRLALEHQNPEVRLAACQVLIGLDQQEWLEEMLL